MELDAELQKIKEWVEAPKVGVVNPSKMQEVMDSYVIIRNIIRSSDPDATIEIVEGALQMGAVSISAVTSDVTVYDTATFAEAIKNADNFQVYPRTDDKVKLDILFEGVIEYTLQD
jgi:hypothetical protein